MFISVFHFLIVISLTVSEFLLLHDQGVPTWTTYYSLDPTDCSQAGLLRHFPDIYSINNSTNGTLGPPLNFTVDAIEREALELGGRKNFYYPGAVVSFYPPEHGTVDITGYEILMYKNKGRVCIILDFLNRNWHSETQIEMELFPLYGLTHYRLTVTSLPQYGEHQQCNTTDLVTGEFGKYKTEEAELPPPANWYAAVTYDVIDDDSSNDTVRSVEFVFSRPPPEYNFQRFAVVLATTEGRTDIRTAKTSTLFYVFENIPQGNYKFMMWPVDEYFSHTGRCLCHLANGACSNCVSTEIEHVIIT